MENTTLKQWLEELASQQPTPGGGGAAALAAAVAAGLIGMVSIYTTGEKWPDRRDRMQAISNEAAILRAEALGLMQADADAFAKVGAAYALTKDTKDDIAYRLEMIQYALQEAAKPPTVVVNLGTKLLALAESIVPEGNPNVISDVAVAASQIRAALEGAIVNIEINAKLITNEQAKEKLALVISTAEEAIEGTNAVVAAVRGRITA